MDNLTQINYIESLRIFKQAEDEGRRLRFGELETSRWLQKQDINLDFIKEIYPQYPDIRIVIIGQGKDEGFYIYSKKKEACFKIETVFKKVK